MYDKETYRTILNGLKKYVKLSVIAKECGIHQPNLSKFLKDSAYNDTMSVENLDLLYKSVKSTLINLK